MADPSPADVDATVNSAGDGVDDASSSAELESKSYSLNVLEVIKTSQMLNGLRHSDYQRYRQYCTRRLHRIRRSLKVTQGKGKFQENRIQSKNAKSDRHLLIPLVSSERAWTYAQELKEEYSFELKEKEHPNHRLKHHMKRKFKRAVFWAEDLNALCAEVADDRTKLEAQAYLGFIRGSWLVEAEDWPKALESFVHAQKIYEQLGKVGDSEQRERYASRVKEIDPTIRFCKYSYKRATGRDAGELLSASAEPLGDGAPSDSSELQDKLERVLAEERKKMATAMREVTWRGEALQLKPEKLRETLLQAQDVAFMLETSENVSESLSMYERMLGLYMDAIVVIRAELKKLTQGGKLTDKKRAASERFLNLEAYVTRRKLSSSVDRDVALASDAVWRMTSETLPDGVKRAKPSDLVRLYNNAAGHMDSCLELSEGEADTNAIISKKLGYHAHACYYNALGYYRGGKWAEATALLEETGALCQKALEQWKLCPTVDEKEEARLTKLALQAVGKTAAVRAEAFSEANSAGSRTPSTRRHCVSETLEEYNFGPPDRMANIPPSFKAVPVKPALFDLAFDFEFPDLEGKKKKKGWFGGWF